MTPTHTDDRTYCQFQHRFPGCCPRRHRWIWLDKDKETK